ncbi:MAG: tRNA 2-thiouridine(34) synthase MnmA [Mycoplasmataceae bacterium]|nr:tRNA 2-thiouridine(34) synthase MnmA [Mycoplasmataceae bacterium]
MKKNKIKKIVLGMSGGVDSSVCAYLLKKQGYRVIGLFMQNWDSMLNNDILGHKANEDKECNAYKDFNDAKSVGEKLGIEVYKVDFIKKYWDDVFKYLIREYKQGRTPNPDVLCNKYIKFDAFINYAKQKFNCDNIAMGHYADTKIMNGKKYLTLSKDEDKDQTYFLCWLNQNQLNKCTFPLGNLTKIQVRDIAKKVGLNTFNKKESTGICFIGERNFKDFLKNYIKPKSGNIIDIVPTKPIGKHDGIMYYTIGQNKNLNLGGNNTKYYVCKKDVKKNILYVVNEKNKSKYLVSTKCELEEFNWINNAIPENKNILIRFRHRQKLIKGKFEIKNKKIFLFYTPTLSVANGQFGVLYQNNVCLGGGIIKTTN